MSEVPSAAEPARSSEGRMRGRICMVTGGGSGIGRATALKMAMEGAGAVIVAGRREPELEATVTLCRDLGADAVAVRTDVTREDEVEGLVAVARDRYGGLDVAFNNAGFQERRAPLEQQASTVYDDVFDANVRSVFLCLRAQLRVMFARGQGRIVINASVSGMRNPQLTPILPLEAFGISAVVMVGVCISASVLALQRLRKLEPAMVFR